MTDIVKSAQTAVQIGDIAPDFCLPDPQGELVSLKDFRGKATVVLFFYPRDYTPICTLESIAFRDSYEDFKRVGAEVIGISEDDPQSHAGFCAKHNLPFKLLTDKSHETLKKYGAHSFFGGMNRVTYVIGKDGVVKSIYHSALRAKKHVSTALEAAQALNGSAVI